MKQSTIIFLGAVASLVAGLVVPPAEAVAAPRKAAPNAAPAEPPAIAPAALDLLEAMSTKLAAAKSISFVTRGSFDVPGRKGQPLLYFTRSEVLMVRPDKLRVIVPGDGPPSEFYFDGKTIAAFEPDSDFVATMDAPGNLDAALEVVYKRAGIYFPFVDFVVTDPYKTLTEGLTTAFVIGKSKVVGDTETDIVALANRDTSLQIWIGTEDKLPRLVWATAIDRPNEPSHMVAFSDWKLDGESAEAESFAPELKDSTKKIPFAGIESAATKDAQPAKKAKKNH